MELNKSALVVLLYLSIAVISAYSAAVYSGKPSDLEVGTLSPEDKLLFILTSELEPVGGVEYVETGVYSEQINITYVNITETGQYPDARAFIMKGGPASNNVTVRLIPGPTLGFNYTVRVHGNELPLIPDDASREYYQFEKRKYVERK